MNQNGNPDYLAKIAARTVPFNNYGTTQLDPRFDRLREKCQYNFKHRHESNGVRDLNSRPELTGACPGYTIVRDLAVLAVSLYNMPLGGWACNVFGLHGEANTPIEAAAKAVWEWLEAEEKDMT